MRLDFYYDIVCPFAYLAATQIRTIAARAGAELVYKPMLLGGVFKAIGAPDQPAASPAKARHNLLDMHRFADSLIVPLARPDAHPRRTVEAMRAIVASGDLPRASDALFRAYWCEGADISERAVIARALSTAGLDGDAIVARLDASTVKDELRARTDEAVQAGVFGAPTFVVHAPGGPELFWGQDRSPFVEALLGGRPLREAVTIDRRSLGPARGKTLEFFFDYSSPYSYLAATQIEAVAALTGARLVLKPFLLGGLFKAIGQADAPLLAFSEPKRRHALADLQRWSAHWGVPFNFPSRFPMNTVAALRATLLAGDDALRLMRPLFHAYWVEDRELADRQVVAEIVAAAGLGRVLKDLDAPATKDALRQSTSAAVERGLFGAPTCIVDGQLYWGQDRLGLVARALTGWVPPRG